MPQEIKIHCQRTPLRYLEQIELPKAYINKNKRLVFNKDILESACLSVGNILQFSYDRKNEILTLELLPDASVIDENLTLKIPPNLVDILEDEYQLETIYNYEKDVLELSCLNKTCLYCGGKEGRKIDNGKYMCAYCLEKLKFVKI